MTERQAALASAVPRESELRPGLRLVALFPNAFDGEPFACELIGTAAQGRVAVRFDDGLEHESTVRRSPAIRPPSPAPRPPPTRACAQLHALRLLLDQPLFAAAQQRQRGQEGAAAPPSRGASQQRAVVRSLVCQEAFRHGPLHRAMAAFEGAWRGAAVPAEASLEANAAGVPGLHVCRGFLNEEEARRPPRPPSRRRCRGPRAAAPSVRCAACVGSTPHTRGGHCTTGAEWARRRGSRRCCGPPAAPLRAAPPRGAFLTARVPAARRRIDFGPPSMTAEGVAAARSFVQPIGALRKTLVALLAARLRAAFAATRLWEGTEVNMMQFTQIGSGDVLANHYDRRDKWDEGIASIGWSEAAGADARGDPWTLTMACGLKGPAQRNLKLSLPAGCAYILSGPAQGRTGTCERGKVAHEQCGCCWTHGVANDASSLVRQSVTLRVYQKAWGYEEDAETAKAVKAEDAGGAGPSGE